MMHSSVAKLVLTLLSGVGAGFYPMFSFALELGDLQVESRLNQPLHARIEIVGISDDEWRQIHARLTSHTLSSDGSAHPELLESVTLSVTENASHRHFIEIKSDQVFTEPLFDLPIEVAGQTLQVVRNYSVMLDPATTEEAPQSLSLPAVSVAAQPTQPGNLPESNGNVSEPPANDVASHSSDSHEAADAQPAAAHPATIYTVTRSDTLGRIVRRLGARTTAERNRLTHWILQHNPAAFHGKRHHLRAGARLILPERIPALSRKTGSHLSAHPAKASRPHPSAPSAPTAPNASDASSSHSTSGGAPSETAESSVKSPMQEQLQGQLTTLQQTLTKMQETITAQDAEIANLTRQIAARTQTSGVQSQAAASASSEEDDEDSNSYGRPAVYYWGVGLGMAVILAIILAKWGRRRNARSMRVPFEGVPLKKATPERPPSVAALQPDVAPRDRSSQQRQAEKEDRKTSDRDDAFPSTGGVESWRTQTSLLERDVVFHTDALPFVMGTGNQAKPAENTLNFPAVEDEETIEIQTAHSGTHKEIVRALENTLNMEPGRVDIQLKLLEIYHHEALGNRESFQSLLNRLPVDSKLLSPDQRLHVETLRRTLQDSELDTDPDPTAKIAV